MRQAYGPAPRFRDAVPGTAYDRRRFEIEIRAVGYDALDASVRELKKMLARASDPEQLKDMVFGVRSMLIDRLKQSKKSRAEPGESGPEPKSKRR